MSESDLTKSQQRLERLGDFVEHEIGRQIERRFEAPLLAGEPAPQVWYRVPIALGMSGDGSAYHIYIKKGTCDHLVVFLSGGGVAWNEYTAARPVTGAKVAADLPNYYWNNLRPFTQLMNINAGITEIGNAHNPCDAWNFIVITYATGDLHVGDCDFPYEAEDGSPQVLHFHGHKNFLLAMQEGMRFFPAPDKLLIAGDSAGAFAVPACTATILEDFYPEVTDVTLLSDSGQLLYKHWRRTARDVWQAPRSIWEPIHTANITVDWYRQLYSIFGDRLTYLYAASTRDYLLSAYLNDVLNHHYATDAGVQQKYFRQLQNMVDDLKGITPKFGIFLYRWANLRFLQGGTVHTAVRHMRFYLRTAHGPSMAEWLRDACEGRVRDVNMDLLKGADTV